MTGSELNLENKERLEVYANVVISSCCFEVTVRSLSKVRAARAARLFFPHLINQILNLWCRCLFFPSSMLKLTKGLFI